MLVDAGLVRERVLTDDRLVPGHRDAGVVGHQAAGPHQFGRVQSGADAVDLGSGVKRHDHFLEGGVARSLADAVDRHFDLARAGLDRRQRVRGGAAEIVVAVRRPDDAVGAVGVLHQVPEQVGVLDRHVVADRVGDVQGGGALGDGQRENLDHEVRVGAAAVLGAELDVVAERPGVRDHVADLAQYLLAGHAQLALHVQVRGRDEGVDPRLCGIADPLPGLVDVLAPAAGEPRDDRSVAASDLPRDPPYALQVVRARGREAGLHDVDAEHGELARHLEFLGARHRCARRLLAVAQRGVEDPDVVAVRPWSRHRYTSLASRNGIIRRSSRPTSSIGCVLSFARRGSKRGRPFRFSAIQSRA